MRGSIPMEREIRLVWMATAVVGLGLPLSACSPEAREDEHGGGPVFDDDDTVSDDDDTLPPCDDADGDGLHDPFEEEIGTNPGLPDTDGDGYSDGSEWFSYSDPLNVEDHVYLDGQGQEVWPHAPYPLDLVGTGFEVGDTAGNFSSPDYWNQQVNLYSFYGSVVQVVALTDGCGGSAEFATAAEPQYQQYRDQGFVTIVLMLDATLGGSPEPVVPFVDYYGLSMPVLNDADSLASLTIGLMAGIPHYALLGRDLTFRFVGGSTPPEDVLSAALDEPPPQFDWPQPECE